MTRGRRRSLLLALLTSGLSASANTQTADLPGATAASLDVGLTLISIAVVLIATLVLMPLIARTRDRIHKLRFRQRMHGALARTSADALHDFLLPGAYGGLIRIDHAIMTPAGVVCIRTKQLRGRILTDLRDSQWEVSDGESSHRFLNPVIQNDGRAAALRRIVPDVPVHSLIVLDGPCDFDRGTHENVVPTPELKAFVEALPPMPLTDGQTVDDAWLQIRSAALTDPESRKDFAAQLSFG